jgi:hypothetical protein
MILLVEDQGVSGTGAIETITGVTRIEPKARTSRSLGQRNTITVYAEGQSVGDIDLNRSVVRILPEN